MALLYLLSSLIFIIGIFSAIGSIWGVVTRNIIRNKGYQENWFWWGFFFGLIAVIVALSKPDISNKYVPFNTPADAKFENLKKIKAYKELLDVGAITQEDFEERKDKLLKSNE